MPADLVSAEQRGQLARLAYRRNWGPALLLVGWLHLLVFCACYALTVLADYHDSEGYLALWIAEILGMALIFRLCGGPRQEDRAPGALERFIRRVWITYFILAFNLGSLNTLRGNQMFEFFPAMATLASFAFAMMAVVVHPRFFLAVLVMYGCGLLMAAQFTHAYLLFAVAWWLVLTCLGLALRRPRDSIEPGPEEPAAVPFAPLSQETPQNIGRDSGSSLIHRQTADIADGTNGKDRAAAGGIEDDHFRAAILRIHAPRHDADVPR